jgi:NAD(P)-dependent dehydrogenase (short-subunit alcohol dehydrogenase family)
MSGVPSLAGKVAVVTGASRGIGKGIATVLGGQGATVYVTGRTTVATGNAASGTNTSGTIDEIAEAITAAGSVGFPFDATTPTTNRSRLSSSESKLNRGISISW